MPERNENHLSRLMIWAALLLILGGAGYFRFVGIDWDLDQHLHPDERFLTMVESSISPVSNLSAYFNTAESSLNPNNRGHGFYVYGTLPLFMVRYAAELVGKTGYGGVHLVGRALSATVDLLTVFLVFMIGSQLFDRRVGLLGAAFSAFAVLQIQHAHFFTVDTFATFFTVLSFYFAAEVVKAEQGQVKVSSFLLFGLALGMASASKISAVPVAVTLPAAAWLYWRKTPSEEEEGQRLKLAVYVLLAAIVSLLTFRVFQPYAFSGPGFLGLKPNPQWVSNLKTLRAQTGGDVDFPPALQWARRPLWFALKNMVLWGLGLPLGLLAWTGFGVMGWRMFKNKSWSPHLVLWGWTGLYFVWQSLQWNSMMRYQLPIYPLLAVIAGWLVVTLWDSAREGWRLPSLSIHMKKKVARALVFAMAGLVLLSSLGWAFAFTRIYTRPHTRIEATRWIFQNIPGAVTFTIHTEEGTEKQLQYVPYDRVIQASDPWQVSFEPRFDGELTEILLPHVLLENEDPENHLLALELAASQNGEHRSFKQDLEYQEGEARVTFQLQEPLALEMGKTYQLTISAGTPQSAFSLEGSRIANESSWDDGLPLRMEGYDPFGGIYPGGLNFEMYWDDNREKLERFLSTLDAAEYLIISSSRQWASIPRLPERYPLSTKYYRELLGCPPEMSLEGCYNTAKPGQYEGNLGFELVKVFQSNPRLGPITINDQPAEEAFTVYDHPKVFVFRKTGAYDPSHVEQVLGSVDLSKVVHLTPKEADDSPGNLMLPPGRLEEQRQGGTWDRLFDVDALVNRSQVVGLLVWYLSVSFLGLITYPILRVVFSGLSDRGYPFARTAGMLLLSYGAWLAGSFRVPFSRLTIGVVLLILALAGGLFARSQWEDLKEEWRKRKKYFLIVEGIALAVFLLGILVRYGNPDLWHPWKGGEKPMDFSYFNAVLKSTSFPPYDPWFAGGYINYYYYGFVFVGVLVKLLGIVPSFAYNLILPTLLAMLALGGFSLSWNLFKKTKNELEGDEKGAYRTGVAGLLGVVILGNLGTMRMMYRGFQHLAAGGVDLKTAAWFTKLKWAALGLVQFLKTASFPFRLDEWYWNPSRVIAGEHGGPITEFPSFTFIYGDLHAHFIALPLTLLALAWAISTVFNRYGKDNKRAPWGKIVFTAVFGGLAVGVLKPTNTWDFYPYLALGVVAIITSWWRDSSEDFPKRLGITLGHIALYAGFALLLFQPYARWYGQGYTSIRPYVGSKTPLSDYLTHWGLFLFLILSWMIYESVHWMAITPVSALRKLEKWRDLILAFALFIVVIMVSFGVPLEEGISIGEFKILGTGVHIIWFVLPLMVWALVLLFNPHFSMAKRMVTFLIGTALALTLMVEVVNLEGDIGRMNTVFKFYLQAWVLMAVSAAACLGWIWRQRQRWSDLVRNLWHVGFAVLVIAAAFYPILGGLAKIKDRMTAQAPHTLDGMTFMAYAEYYDVGVRMDLSQDYRAIRWMQENIQGSPVIVEANQVEYHWGTRYTIYTGLPGVVGWSWHQRQQRNITPHEWVWERVNVVNGFYETTDLGEARDFLQTYDVSYIVLGQLERAKYAPSGLEKFPAAEGVLWQPVFETEETIIYEVIIPY
ncbi:MAG: DUF2298 domain-containing protein [Anaerolineales bacterium]